MGLLAWLGFISVGEHFTLVIYEKRSYELFLVSDGYQALTLAIMGAILASGRGVRRVKSDPRQPAGASERSRRSILQRYTYQPAPAQSATTPSAPTSTTEGPETA